MDKKVNLRPKQSLPMVGGRRQPWKSESSRGNAIQTPNKQRSELSKNADEQCKELSASADEIKKSPTQIKKTRADVSKQQSVSVDGIYKRPAPTMKARSATRKESDESSNAGEKSRIQLRKVKSEAIKALNGDGNEKNTELRKTKSESNRCFHESCDEKVRNSLQLAMAKPVSMKSSSDASTSESRKGQLAKGNVIDGSNYDLEILAEDIKKIPIEIKRTHSDESCKDFDVCEEKVITSNLSTADGSKSASEKQEVPDDYVDGVDVEEEDRDEVLEDGVGEEVEVEIEKRSLVVKEISIAEQRPKKVVIEEEKHRHNNERPVHIPPIVKKQPPVASNLRIHPAPSKTKETPVSEEVPRSPRRHSKLQSLVDLVMWKNASKSALIFGIGTFVIISSSYTQDLNISIISVLSSMSLLYLAAIFLFRSFTSRGATEMDNSSQDHVVGEEEAVWFVKLILPYVNEFLLKIKALFSGDPATTMKMALLLFVLARSGSSITIWKMAKLGFFGVFVIPKVCSCYSTQITAYSTFWNRCFRDAWESSSHKKGIAFGVFTLVWNLSSIFARIWAVFMLFVVFKYYQQSVMIERWTEVEARTEDSWEEQIERHRKERRTMTMETRKQKKAF